MRTETGTNTNGNENTGTGAGTRLCTVRIIETYSSTIIVEAPDRDHAWQIASRAYNNRETGIMDEDNYAGYEIIVDPERLTPSDEAMLDGKIIFSE